VVGGWVLEKSWGSERGCVVLAVKLYGRQFSSVQTRRALGKAGQGSRTHREVVETVARG
jgi:hypothetical protein